MGDQSSPLRVPTKNLEPVITKTVERIDTCPQCQSMLKLSAPEVPHQICRSCGYVIGGEATVGSLDEITDSEQESSEQTWSEFYSVTNSTEQQVATAYEQIESVVNDLCLDSTLREQAADVYGAASQVNLTDGRPTTLVVGAAICIGSREIEQPRPTERVAAELNLESNRLKQMVRQFQSELARGYVELSPTAYLEFPCKEAELSKQIQLEAEQLIESVTESEKFTYTSVHPSGIAGAAIYIASSGDITQQRIATLTGVSRETIRQRVADLQEAMSA